MTSAGEVRVWVSGRSDPGRMRSENQDRLLFVDLGATSSDSGQSNGTTVDPVDFALGPAGAILLVADGVGGRAGGAEASRIAAAEIERRMIASSETTQCTAREFVTRLSGALDHANAAVHVESGAGAETQGMATTATLVGLLRGHAYIAQVGDSRAYLVRGAAIGRLTRDQSLVQDLIDSGVLSEDDTSSVPDNVILQALGTSATVRPAVTFHELKRDDLLLLCSDGLSGVVSDAELCAAVGAAADLATLCDTLVDMANARGGPDNITVLVAHVSGSGLDEPAEAPVVERQPYAK